MRLYFAPIEGLGGYVYRNAQADLFSRADKYFAPFLSPGAKKRLTPKALRDLSPEHNPGIPLVPQVLTNDSQAFVETAEELAALGWREVNLNLGCPSGTVVNKGRGAGFLADPDALDRFFDAVFRSLRITGRGAPDAQKVSPDIGSASAAGNGEIRVSVKTRLGMSDPGEFTRILGIYDRYPISELTIHPRVRSDLYRNHPDLGMFAYALEHTEIPVVYNGDLFCCADLERFREKFPTVDAVMLGRGILCDPALFGEIRSAVRAAAPDAKKEGADGTPELDGGDCLTKERLEAFHGRLLADYSEVLSGDSHVLFKMKELWYYMIHVFSDSAKYEKAIKKAQNLRDYREAVKRLFAEREIRENDFSSG